MQAAKIAQLEKQIQTLESDKAELATQRDSALKEVEGIVSQYPDFLFDMVNRWCGFVIVNRKIKSQAQFDVLVGKIKRLEGARDEVANAATPRRCSLTTMVLVGSTLLKFSTN